MVPAAAMARYTCGASSLRGGHIEGTLQREDVALQPGQQVHAGAQAGGRDLRDVDVRVDQARHDHQRAQVDRGLRGPGRIGGGADRADAAGLVDLDDAVGLPQRVALWQGAQQARSQRERRLSRA